MKKCIYWTAFAGLFFSTLVHAGIKDSVGVTKINDKPHILYLVSPGETIYGISTKYGIPVTDLLELNPELEKGLRIGQIINVPYNETLVRARAAAAKAEDVNIYHDVQAGETLYSISKKYNISVNELMKLNNMQLRAGQKLIVGLKTTEEEVLAKDNLPKTENKEVEKKEVKDVAKVPAAKDTTKLFPNLKPYDFDPNRMQVLVIPFDPYLYFSDADAEIASKSNIPMNKVRQYFRLRLNAMLDAEGYETIHLVGGKCKDSTSDINKIYQSLTYGYQDVIVDKNNPKAMEYLAREQAEAKNEKSTNSTFKDWFTRTKDKLAGKDVSNTSYELPQDMGQYFGARMKDPNFFTFFNQKYDVDYYIFVNQFEVKTNYENCLDRAALNYERTFTTHYSIFDKNGKQVAGNKFKTKYESNSSYIKKIVSDNIPKITERILADLPPPSAVPAPTVVPENKK